MSKFNATNKDALGSTIPGLIGQTMNQLRHMNPGEVTVYCGDTWAKLGSVSFQGENDLFMVAMPADELSKSGGVVYETGAISPYAGDADPASIQIVAVNQAVRTDK